jgi:hypothetical protein
VKHINVSFLVPWYPSKSGLIHKHTVKTKTYLETYLETYWLTLVDNTTGTGKHGVKLTVSERAPVSSGAFGIRLMRSKHVARSIRAIVARRNAALGLQDCVLWDKLLGLGRVWMTSSVSTPDGKRAFYRQNIERKPERPREDPERTRQIQQVFVPCLQLGQGSIPIRGRRRVDCPLLRE